MRSFRVLTDAKAWTLREWHDPAQPSCSAYSAAHGRIRGTVAPRFAALHMSAYGTKLTYRCVYRFDRFREQSGHIRSRGFDLFCS